MKTYIKLTITDRKGMLLWEETLSSPQAKGKIFNPNKTEFPESSGRAAAMSVAIAFRDATRKIAGSREIHAYASEKGKPKAHISLISPKPSITIRSDVDELPPVQAKLNKNAYAIVIWVEKYRQNLPKADFARQDATVMAEHPSSISQSTLRSGSLIMLKRIAPYLSITRVTELRILKPEMRISFHTMETLHLLKRRDIP